MKLPVATLREDFKIRRESKRYTQFVSEYNLRRHRKTASDIPNPKFDMKRFNTESDYPGTEDSNVVADLPPEE